ncbi:sensor histidine kinase [Maricaulis parjimensis]|uniref:sensor histidine kinase n=1 Tax=Maricaulis parjimensis TaxID=144023 RepID=UPI00193A6827|nr:ATP-binding protein [Maricaulis parjimensis]
MDVGLATAAAIAIWFLWQNARVIRTAGAELSLPLMTGGLVLWGLYYGFQFIVIIFGPFVFGLAQAELIANNFEGAARWITNLVATGLFLAGLLLLLRGVNRLLQRVQESADALETEISHRDTEAEELKSEAAHERDFRKAKSEFLMGLSHELRTPLNGVIGLASLLSNTNLENDQRKLLTTLEHSAQAMLSRVSDVFDLSLLETERVELRSALFVPQDVSRAAVGLFEPLAAEKGLTLTCDCEDMSDQAVIGDPVRVRQVLSHLLSNAIKFTPSGSIAVKVSSKSIDADHVAVSFSVSDTGVGMSDSVLEQANKGPVMQSGAQSGIGLSICWRLAWLMDGGLSFQSEADKGTTATATLRFQVEPAPADEDF